MVFERKSLGDLYGTLGKGNRRFKREVDRALEDGSELRLVIEGTYTEVGNGTKFSRMPGRAILRSLATFDIKYGIRYWAFMNRAEMKRYIEYTFESCARHSQLG